MDDTSVKIDKETRDRFKALAGGKPLKEYLAELAKREEHERALNTATAAFRRVIEPGVLDRFDADFGGIPPATAHETPQAA
ncbi:antitoxin MazE7 [Streptomyces hypolithicus]